MFKNLIGRIKEAFYKMGLISGVKKVADGKKTIMSESMHDTINNWKAIYKGYYPAWHDVTVKTVGGSKTRRRSSLNIGKVIAEEMANLVFNEQCEISIDDEDFSKNIKNVLSKNAFVRSFQDNLEYMFALGGSAIEVLGDKEGIYLDYVAGDSFIPIAEDGRKVTEGIFVRESHKGNKKFTRLRWHTWERDIAGQRVYMIRNELYESDIETELGVRIPLERLYPELQEATPVYDITEPLFVYFKPNKANNIDLSSRLGVSIFSGALDTMEALDIAFDSFKREFILGKKRILVPATAVKTVVDPVSGTTKRYFDADDEVYQAMNFESDQTIKDMSVELRVDEHIGAINAFLNILAMQTGFSAGAFTFDGQGLKTATEVISENSKTYRSRSGHAKIIEEGLKDLIVSIGQVAELYELFNMPAADYEVRINFDDSIAEDRNTNTAYWVMLAGADIGVPKSLALQKILKITEEEALRMIAKAAEENKIIGPESLDFFGMSTEKTGAAGGGE